MDEKLKVGFIGSMNVMPMQYALQFRRNGYDVKYIVESKRINKLMRPEHHYKEINYPYPDWIIESNLIKVSWRMVFPRLLSRKILNEMKDRDVILLNDYGLSLGGYFPNAIKIGIFSGSDFYEYCDLEKCDYLVSCARYPFFLRPVVKYCLKRFMKRCFGTVNNCNILSFFPKGMVKQVDNQIEKILKAGNSYDIRRYDSPLNDLGLEFLGAKKSNKLIISSFVRFLIKTSKENEGDYKGNDIIIKGVAEYYKINKNIELHLVDKPSGADDIVYAKQLIHKLGLDSVVTWHKDMSFKKLISLYKKSDVCFDQVGNHWMGAIGMYALYMRKPLITNLNTISKSLNWTNDIPILSASSPLEVCQQLVVCSDYDFRKSIANIAHEFAKLNFDPSVAYRKYLKAIYEIIGV